MIRSEVNKSAFQFPDADRYGTWKKLKKNQLDGVPTFFFMIVTAELAWLAYLLVK